LLTTRKKKRKEKRVSFVEGRKKGPAPQGSALVREKGRSEKGERISSIFMRRKVKEGKGRGKGGGDLLDLFDQRIVVHDQHFPDHAQRGKRKEFRL